MPRVRIGSGTLHCLPPFSLSVPLPSCAAVFVVGGEVRWGCVSLPPPVFVFAVTALLVWCCVFMAGLCHCGMVVMIVCGAEGCVVSAVHCQLCVLLWRVFQGGVRVVLLCCVVGCGMAAGWCEGVRSRCLFSSSLCPPPLPLLLPLCVGVRGSARAALRARTLSPNTIVSSAYCSSSPPCSSPFFSSLSLLAFLCLEWRWVIHHVLECCVGMTAMGSLSRSSSFFW